MASVNAVEIHIKAKQDKPDIKDISKTYKEGFRLIQQEAKKSYETLKQTNKISFSSLKQSFKDISTNIRTLNTREKEAIKRLFEFEKASRKAARSQNTLTGSLKSFFAAYASYLSTASVANFLSGAIKSYAEFDAEIRRAGAAAGLAGKQLEQFRQIARKMGMETRFSATEAASALKYLSMAGLSANDAMKALPVTLQLATAGSMDLGEAADIVTNIMTQYNKKASDMAMVSDILTKTFTSSNTNLQELGQAFSYAGAIAYSAGQKFTDVSTILGLMANAGFKADRAGTALRESLARLMDAPDEAKRALDRLGISIYKADGSMRSLIDILYDLKKAGASTSDMIKIFGLRAAPAMIAVMNNSKESIEKFREALEKSQGTTKKVADEINGGLDGALKELKSKMDEVRLSIGAAINKDGELIDQLQDLVNWLVANKEKVDELAVSLSHVAAEIVKVIEAVSKFIIEHQKMLKLIGEGVLALYAWRKVLLLIEAIKASEFIMGIAAALKSFKTAAELATVAGRAFLTKVVLPLAVADAAYNIYRLTKAMYEYRKELKEAEEAKKEFVKSSEELKQKLIAVGKATGYNIQTWEDFDRLLKEHKIVLDEITGTYRRTTKEEQKLAEQAKKTAKEQEKQAEKVKIYSQQELIAISENLYRRERKHKQVIDKIQEKETQLKDKIINLQKELADKIKSIEEQRAESITGIESQIREIKRKGMDDELAYYDKMDEASKDYEKAKAALAKNNFELYKFYINKYKALVTSTAGEEIKVDGEIAVSKEQTMQAAIAGLNKIKTLENEYYTRKEAKEKEIYKQKITQVKAELEATKAQIKAEKVIIGLIEKALSMIDKKGTLKIQTDDANKQLGGIIKQIDDIENNIGKKKTVKMDTKEAKENINEMGKKYDETQEKIERNKIKVSVDNEGIIKVETLKAGMADINKETEKINSKKVTINVDTEKANENVKKLIETVKNNPMEISIDDKNATIKVNNIKTQISNINDKTVKISVDDSEMYKINNIKDKKIKIIPKIDMSALKKLEDRLAKPINKIVYVETREKHRYGGVVGFAKGGKIAGYGGGDRIPALLEAGEYVIRKESVAKYGVSLLNKINTLNFDGNINTANNSSDIYKRFEIKIGDAKIEGVAEEGMLEKFENAMRRKQLYGV